MKIDIFVFVVKIEFSIKIIGFVPNFTSFSKNISKLLTEITKEGQIKFDMDNEIIKGCLVTHEGEIVHEMTKNIIEGDI